MSQPKRSGALTTMPSKPPVNDAFWKTNAVNTDANASVTIAKVTPRVRIAGNATSSPTTTATTTPNSADTTKGVSKVFAQRAAANAPKPASANWQSDNCPA